MSEEAIFLPPKPTVFSLAPGASRSIDGPGTFARIMEASGPLKIGFNLGTTFPAEVGQAYGTPIGQKFNRVTIENPSDTATVLGLIVTGDLIIYDDRLHVISNKTNGLALDGTDGTGIVPPAGAAGIRGWLSGIYSALSGGTININTTGMSTEVTLAAVKTRADLLGTETTLAAVKTRADLLATEAKLEAVRVLLAALGVTAGTLATETKLEAVRALLAGSLVTREVNPGLGEVADVNCGAGARTLLLAAATAHNCVIVTNPETAAAAIRVGSVACAANQGQPVQPGQTVAIPTSAAVYAWNPTAGAIAVSVLFTN